MNDKKKGANAGFWVATSLAIFFALCTATLFLAIIGIIMVKGTLSYVEEHQKRSLSEEVVEGAGPNKIVIIPVKGIITARSSKKYFYETPSMVDSLKDQLEQASEDDGVKAVILEIDSPGGGITASDIIHKEIIDFKERTGKKVIVSMQDVAASGGYYIAAAADKIIAHPTTITGSIGVIMPIINMADLVKKYGIEDISVTSGEMKNLASPFKKMTDRQRKILLDIVDEMHAVFMDVISKGRNMDIEDVRKLADGRIYTGAQALENGLVDQLGYNEDAILVAKEISGLKDATIIKYKKAFTLSEIFAVIMNNLSRNRTIEIDLKGITIDDDTPRFMYLWTGYR